MKPKPILLAVALAPVLSLGMSSCTTLKTAQARYQQWQEKREEKRQEKQVAAADKDAALPTEQARLGDAQEPPIFLDFNNPDHQVAAETKAEGDRDAGFRLAGGQAPTDLPGSVGEFMNAPTIAGESYDSPIFREDIMPPAAVAPPAPADPAAELIKAWAGSISPVTGSSIAEPLITAVMTATPPERSVEVLPVTSPRLEPTRPEMAAAFAGRRVTSSQTSEHEHQR